MNLKSEKPQESKVKIGLEVHFQLDTGKLFCECSTTFDDKELFRFTRRLVPTMSEMGKIDPAAEYEKIRSRLFEYIATGNSCLVEYDEEPPHQLNSEALETALAVSKALNCKAVDYISCMRKVVVDGSNTSGFQRTSVVGFGGFINTSKGKVRISSVCLEEDSARKVSEKMNVAVYSLDRLGVPLIEIATEPDVIDEDHAVEVAKIIGHYVMATGKAKKGPDAIRQDVNFSMGYGRVEIKGIPKLSQIKDSLKYEISRQRSLADISSLIAGRGGFQKDKFGFSDVTEYFVHTNSKMIKNGLSSNYKVFGSLLSNMGGTLKSGIYRFGRELSDIAKVFGLGGVLHSDELPAYGISQLELEPIYRIFGKTENDAVLMVLSPEVKIEWLSKEMIKRIDKLLNLELSETRALNEDGTTRYLRPLPGRERMYPETDVPQMEITSDMLRKAEENAPASFEETSALLTKEYGISRQDAQVIVSSLQTDQFETLVRIFNDPRLISRILLQIIPDLEKKHKTTIEYDDVRKMLEIAHRKNWIRQSVEKALEIMVSENASASSLESRDELEPMSDAEIKRKISDLKLKYGSDLTEKNVVARMKSETEKVFDPSKIIKSFKELK